jgi:hypothetical protein
MLSFKQFEFQPNQNFEPSKDTKEFWLYTKKSKRTFAGVTLPGLYETVGYSTQMIAFFAIFILEIIPTVYGIEEGVLWQAIVAAIFIDIAFAIVSHLWHKKICLHKNELVLAPGEVAKEALNREINRYNFYTYFFYLLILASGCLKFYFFYDAYMTPDAIAGGVLLCYLLGSILHIAYTGYFLYTSRFNYKIQSEYSKYIASGGKSFSITDINPQPIDMDSSNVQIKEYTAGAHTIAKREDGKHYFDTYGVLTDKELAALVGIQQSSLAQSIIAREGLKQQLLNLQGGLTR